MSVSDDPPVGFLNYEDLFLRKDLPGVPLQTNLPDLLENWLDAQQGRESPPLVIRENPLVPTKTALLAWVRQHEQNYQGRNKDEFLVQLGSGGYPSSSAPYMVSRFITSMKERLELTKKVDVFPDSLRMYFSIWLKTIDSTIQNLGLSENIQQFRTLIIVIEGISDILLEAREEISMWVMRVYPPRIKVILTFRDGLERPGLDAFHSEVITVDLVAFDFLYYRTDLLGERPYLPHSPLLPLFLAVHARGQQLNSAYFAGLFTNLLFPAQPQKQILDKILQVHQRIDPAAFTACRSIQDGISVVLNTWFSYRPACRLVADMLVRTLGGIYVKQLNEASHLDQDLAPFLAVLEPYLIINRGLHMIKSFKFRKVLGNKQNPGQAICQVLRGGRSSLRKLRELGHQLFQERHYWDLKELLSHVQNFLILYNPYSKFQLFRFWNGLVKKISMDLVEEFVKGVDSFKNDFLPSEGDQFRILVQISRFLKEFAAFEGPETPEFYHPKLLCKTQDLAHLHLYQEFNDNNLFVPLDDQKQVEEKDLSIDNLVNLKIAQQKTSRKARIPLSHKKETGRRREDWKSVMKGTLAGHKLNNVESQFGRDKFRDGYVQEVKDILRSKGILFTGLGSDNSIVEFYQFPARFQLQAELSNARGEAPNYLYKRWIWIMLPVIAVSLRDNFSQTMRLYCASDTETVSIKDEKELYSQLFSIAASARAQKQQILETRLKPKTLPKLFGQGGHHRHLNLSCNGPQVFKQYIDDIVREIDLSASSYSLGKHRVESTRFDRVKAFISKEESRLQKGRLQNDIQGLSADELEGDKQQSALTARNRHVLPQLQSKLQQIRRVCDIMVNENKHLTQNIVRQKLIPLQEIEVREEERKKQMIEHINRMEKRMRREEKQAVLSKIMLERVSNIIKICKRNEYCHKEWLQVLNDFSANLRRMIKIEEQKLGTYIAARRNEVARRLPSQSEPKDIINCVSKPKPLKQHYLEQLRKFTDQGYFDKLLENVRGRSTKEFKIQRQISKPELKPQRKVQLEPELKTEPKRVSKIKKLHAGTKYHKQTARQKILTESEYDGEVTGSLLRQMFGKGLSQAYEEDVALLKVKRDLFQEYRARMIQLRSELNLLANKNADLQKNLSLTRYFTGQIAQQSDLKSLREATRNLNYKRQVVSRVCLSVENKLIVVRMLLTFQDRKRNID